MPLIRNRLAAWLGILALLAAALLPGVEQLLRSGGGDSWVEVCSATGSHWLRADPGNDKNDSGHTAGQRHCVVCLVAHALVPPPAAAALPAATAPWRALHAADADRRAPAAASAPPRSRGPPASATRTA